jgi:hypothetical protein
VSQRPADEEEQKNHKGRLPERGLLDEVSGSVKESHCYRC